MFNSALYGYVAAALAATLFYRWRFVNLYDIPTIGPSLPVLSYLGAYRFLRDNKAMIQEGYEKFKGRVFKVAMLQRWLIVISGPRLIEEVRKLPDDQVSFIEALEEFLKFHHSFGREVIEDPFQVDVIRDQLTRRIGSFFGDFRDEIILSFSDLIPATDGWYSVNAFRTMQTVVSRVSGRVFMGTSLCHNEEYLNLSVDNTITIMRTKDTLSYFPEILNPIVAFFLDEGRRGIQQAQKLMEPLIQKRLNDMKTFGDDWVDRPDDMLQWLIEGVVSRGKGIPEIVRYMMIVNFAAIHTSSNSLTHALYHLAARPRYMDSLRKEVDSVIAREGWTKASVQKLKKTDSFIRESLRLNGLDSLSLGRRALKDITLSDGTFIPKGSVLVAASASTHLDDEHYDDATAFNPWRFSDLRERDGEANRHQLVSTSVDFIPFGHGKHACPGRFFAASEIKSIFAHIVMNYDVKFENDGPRPEDVWLGNAVIPDPTAKVLFRKRQSISH